MSALRLALATLAFMAAPLPVIADATALTTLNVRSGPGTGYRVVDVLYRGESVDVAGCRPGWCYISTPRAKGWASAGYLAGLVDGHHHHRHADVHHHRHVVVIEKRRHVARWPEPWNEPIYPPRRVMGPTPYGVQYPDRFW